jgi:hypothetical protein
MGATRQHWSASDGPGTAQARRFAVCFVDTSLTKWINTSDDTCY